MKMLRSRRVVLGIGILLALGVGLLWWRARRHLDPVPLRIGKDTTRITAPLSRDGSVDYLAAMNAGDFPPPETNAAIPLLRALGTQCLVGDVARVLELLGASHDLPEAGAFVEPSEEVESTSCRYGADPDDPVRSWLEANREALDLLREASQCEHFRVPVVRDPASGWPEPALSPMSVFSLAEALSARADLARADGKVAEAWADHLVLLRMHVVLNEAPDLWTRISACGVGEVALGGFERLLGGDKFDQRLGMPGLDTLWREEEGSPSIIGAAIAELRALPPLRPLTKDVDRFERLRLLDILTSALDVARVSGWQPSGWWAIDESMDLDPNIMFQPANAAFDRVAAEIRRGGADTAARLSKISEAEMQALVEGLSAIESVTGRVGRFLTEAAERREQDSGSRADLLAQTWLGPVWAAQDPAGDRPVRPPGRQQQGGRNLSSVESPFPRSGRMKPLAVVANDWTLGRMPGENARSHRGARDSSVAL